MDERDIEIAKLKAENAMLRQRIADTSNHDVEELRIKVEDLLAEWSRRVKTTNRVVLRPST